MNDAVITELISAIIVASKDGNGTLTVAAVRRRLTEANLEVEYTDQSTAEEDLEELTRFRDGLSKRI